VRVKYFIVSFALALLLATGLSARDNEKKVSESSASQSSGTNGPAGAAAKKQSRKSTTVSDPVEQQYLKILEMDDAAQTEVDGWIKEFNAFEAQGAAGSRAALSLKVEQRLEIVNKAYEDFLQKNPRHVEALLAYGSFLNEIQKEGEAVVQWNKAREIDPKNPAAYNNLANYYGHFGPVGKAFEYYEKAIELNPNEPVYLENFATTTYLFRKDAMERYKISEPEVFNKALNLYRQALKLDPNNFLLAVDLAQSYYGIIPLRTAEALDAWNYALKIADNEVSRQGVYLHLARVELNSGLWDQARQHLDKVNDPNMDALKKRLERNFAEKKAAADAKSATKEAPAAQAKP
jgi:tetratricopeptide (TPR) repeat protein